MAFMNGTITVKQGVLPLQDATVIVGTSQTKTDASGIARFSSLPDGLQDIVIIRNGNKFVASVNIQSRDISVTVEETATTTTREIPVSPKPVQLLDLGEKSITFLGLALVILIVLSGFIFFIFFRRNIQAYQRQLRQLGLLAIFGTFAGVSALLYSQTSLLTNKTQARKFTQSTRADTRKNIPVPINLTHEIINNEIHVNWELPSSAIPVVKGYLVEWVPETMQDKEEQTKHMVVSGPTATITDIDQRRVYVIRISTIDFEGNFSEPAEFITLSIE